jgi:hypothetical protein
MFAKSGIGADRLTPFTSKGGHNITAVYAGDADFTGVASSILAETVN